MQLSVSSGKYGILQRAAFLTFGNSVDNTTAYPLNDMVASANTWVQRIGDWIWQSSDTWEWDDSSYSDINIATTTLVNSQSTYTLPSTIYQVLRVSILDSSGDYRVLDQIDRSDIVVDPTELYETDGIPVLYELNGPTLTLYPAPDTTQVTAALGLKMEFTREANTFSVPANYTTADTTQPGFDEAFHDIICYGIAHDYLISTDPNKAQLYAALIEGRHQELLRHYAKKNPELRTRVTPRKENYQ